MEKRTPHYDRRLVGTWKSDRAKTFRHFVPQPDCTPEGLRKFKRLFGKFVIRWGYSNYYTELDSYRDIQPYEMLGQDAESVVIRIFDDITQEYVLRQIFFEGDYYWLWAWGMREYFRKVKPTCRHR